MHAIIATFFQKSIFEPILSSRNQGETFNHRIKENILDESVLGGNTQTLALVAIDLSEAGYIMSGGCVSYCHSLKISVVKGFAIELLHSRHVIVLN